MTEKSEFKVGDRVRCVRSDGSDELILGAEYLVDGTTEDDLFAHRDDCPVAGGKCRACQKPLLKANNTVADGCPCNAPRGVNHGLVPENTCTCLQCDPAQTGSARVAEPPPASPPASEELAQKLAADHVRTVLENAARECMARIRAGKPLPDYLPIRQAAPPQPPPSGQGPTEALRAEIVAALRKMSGRYSQHNRQATLGQFAWLAEELSRGRLR